MLYLLLKVASSVGLGLVLKHVDSQGLDRLPVIRINYAVAASLAFIGCVALNQQHISRQAAALAVVTGALFVAGIMLWAQTIRAAGLALSVVALRTAIAIPVLAAVVIWHERPTPIELAGVLLALCALVLVLADTVRAPRPPADRHSPLVIGHSRSPALWLLALFLVDGLVLLSAQVFRRQLPQEQALPFQTVIFVTGFFITTAVYYIRRPRPDPRSLTFGALLGAANLGNYLFLIIALTILPGVVVYPSIAAGEVGLMALAGVLIWKEPVGWRRWLGIGLAVSALILIQLGRTG